MNIKWPIDGPKWDEMKEQGRAWEILIPDWLPSSMNKLLRESWTSYVAERRKIQHFLTANYGDKVPITIDKKRGIQIVIIKTSGQWDDEPNLDGRSKATLDAMVKIGMLRDDNRKFLEWHHVQEVHGTMKGMAIRLWDVD